jgi:hypothetical protein
MTVSSSRDLGLNFLPISRIAIRDFGDDVPPGGGATLLEVAHWMRSYLMSAHPDLGRTGDVCPFAGQAARADLLRIAVSEAGPDDLLAIRRQMLGAFATFDAIPYPRGMANFRAVVAAFPNCASPDGVAALAAVQKSLRRLSFATARMVGVFHQEAEAQGLWNPAFRPLRAPIPLIAIRALVENDAAFVMRHPLLAPAYLRRFRFAGGKRLIARLWTRA